MIAAIWMIHRQEKRGVTKLAQKSPSMPLKHHSEFEPRAKKLSLTPDSEKMKRGHARDKGYTKKTKGKQKDINTKKGGEE